MASQITLAIPNRNNEKYLSQCLASVQLQTVRPLRVVVSDNHSTDHSADVIERFSDIIDERLKPPEALGYMDHLYWILGHVDTDFVIFAAGDDILHPDLIAKYGELLSASSDYMFVCSPFYSIDESSRLMGKVDWSESFRGAEASMKDVFLKGPICNISSVAWNVEALRRTPRLPSEIGNCVDWYLYVYQSAIGRVGLVFQKLLYYRVYSGSTGNSNVPEHTRKCKEMFTWVRSNNLVKDFDLGMYEFLISDFDRVLESERPTPRMQYAHFPARERLKHGLLAHSIKKTISSRMR